MAFKALLFDLDGTLVDARTPAWELFQETNREFDLGINSQEEYFQLSSRNFFAGLVEHCQDEALAEAAAKHFLNVVRERYNPPFIPGIIDVVTELAKHASLAILSSNMYETIQRILDDGGVSQYFPHILAGDYEPSKATAIKNYLAGIPTGPTYANAARSAMTGFASSEVAMVTDTAGDVGEARESGIRVCGVNWGMHGEQQLRAAGAEHVARTPQELIDWYKQTDGVMAEGA